MLLCFIDDLRILVSNYSIKNIVKTFEKVAQKVVKWENMNIGIYNIVKMEAVIFSRLYYQWLYKQITQINI